MAPGRHRGGLWGYFFIISFGISNNGISDLLPVFCRLISIHWLPSLSVTIFISCKFLMSVYDKPVQHPKTNISLTNATLGCSIVVVSTFSFSSQEVINKYFFYKINNLCLMDIVNSLEFLLVNRLFLLIPSSLD